MLEAFMGSMMEVSSLTEEEEKKLFKLVRKNDQGAKEKITLAHVKLVIKIVRKYYKNRIDIDDLIQMGMMRMIEAIDSFKSKCRFAGYLVPCIHGALQKYIEETHIVKRSHESVIVERMINRVQNELRHKLQREPSADEVFDKVKTKSRYKMGRDFFDIVLTYQQNEEVLPFFEEEEQGAYDPTNAINAKIDIEKILATVSPKNREALMLFYGINARPHTKGEIAKKLGVKENTVDARIWRTMKIFRNQYNNLE